MPQKGKPRPALKRATSATQYPGLSERTGLAVRNSARTAFASKLAGLGLPDEAIQSALTDFDRRFPPGKVEVADARPVTKDPDAFPEGMVNLPSQSGSGLINPLPKEFRIDAGKQARSDIRQRDRSLRIREYVERQVEAYSRKQPPASEGFIEQRPNQQAADALPDKPPALWPGRKTGRPRLGEEDLLVEFIRANYGPYFEKFRDKLRAYIYRHDPKLYQAIASYEHRRPLPDDLLMPSEQVRTEERLRRALQGDYGDLTGDEKASVRKKLWRLDKLKPH